MCSLYRSFCLLTLLSIGHVAPAAAAPGIASTPPASAAADLLAAPEARHVADWILASGDNDGLPFIIVDKVAARLFLFGRAGQLRAAVPVLVGSARGDDSVPGIGTRPLAAIRPAERTTPAGRFRAHLGHDSSGAEILWVDYGAAIALHRASDRKPGPSRQSRAQRLLSPDAGDRRASLGCIGVATPVFDDLVRPAFAAAGGIVYILPETRSVAAEFGMSFADAGAVDAGGD